jgi:GT2 family glycosyltransferase
MPIFNCLEETQRTIRSIKSEEEYLFYLIDNGSEKETSDYLDGVENSIVEHYDKNMGVSFGANRGVEGLLNLESSAMMEKVPGFEFILYMNNDLEMMPNAIDKLVEVSRRMPEDVAFISGVNLWDGEARKKAPELIWDDWESRLKEHISFGCDFSCFIARPQMWRNVGLFDENYFMYWEDNDIAERILRLGMILVSYGGSGFIHYASSTLRNNKVEFPPDFPDPEKYYMEKFGVRDRNCVKRYPWVLERVTEINEELFG